MDSKKQRLFLFGSDVCTKKSVFRDQLLAPHSHTRYLGPRLIPTPQLSWIMDKKTCPSFAGFGRESKSNSFCQVQFSVKTNKRNKSKHKGHSLAFKCPLFMWRIDKSWQSKKWFKLKYIIAIVKPPDFQRKAVLLWHGRDWLPNQWGASNLQLVFLFPRGILWAGELFDNSARWPLRRRCICQ